MDLLHVGLILLSVPKPLVWLLTAVHVFFCAFLVLTVLLQRGKAADLGSAFGAGPSQANLAAMSSEDLLTRATKVFAFAFMATSLLLALISHGRPAQVLDIVPEDEAAIVETTPDAVETTPDAVETTPAAVPTPAPVVETPAEPTDSPTDSPADSPTDSPTESPAESPAADGE